jgi:hypothetical protein
MTDKPDTTTETFADHSKIDEPLNQLAKAAAKQGVKLEALIASLPAEEQTEVERLYQDVRGEYLTKSDQ